MSGKKCGVRIRPYIGDVWLAAVTCHATMHLATSSGGRFTRHIKHCSVVGARVARQPVALHPNIPIVRHATPCIISSVGV
jgi:hypothetical protein